MQNTRLLGDLHGFLDDDLPKAHAACVDQETAPAGERATVFVARQACSLNGGPLNQASMSGATMLCKGTSDRQQEREVF